MKRDAYVGGDLADAMRKNPRLRVSLNGLFDLATPFFITEYDLVHLEPRAEATQQHRLCVLGVGSHGVSECRRLEAVEE
jgi:hypothetical protein